MSTQRNIGIGICLLALLGLAYFFIYKKQTPVSSGDDPDAGTEMVKIQHSTEYHERMVEFESRADHYRRQVAHLSQRQALPVGLKENIYAFTEDVRQIDAAKADKYNAEFCEGRNPTQAKLEKRSRSRSAIGLNASTAPLNTDMRDNKTSIFAKLEPGQFNISHDTGVRGLESFSLSFSHSTSPQIGTFNSSPDVKTEIPNAEATQEATVTSNVSSAFDSSPSHNNREDNAIAEVSLSGNKRKLRDPPAKLKKKVLKAELVTQEAFNTFQGLTSDNNVQVPQRGAKRAKSAIVMKRETPTIPATAPNFNSVAVPQNVLASDDVDKTTAHEYLNQLDLCMVDILENFTEAKVSEAEALIALIGDSDPSISTMQYTMQLASLRNNSKKKARDIRNVYGALELENQETARKRSRMFLGTIPRVPRRARSGSTPIPSRSSGYSRHSSRDLSGTSSLAGYESVPPLPGSRSRSGTPLDLTGSGL